MTNDYVEFLRLDGEDRWRATYRDSDGSATDIHEGPFRVLVDLAVRKLEPECGLKLYPKRGKR